MTPGNPLELYSDTVLSKKIVAGTDIVAVDSMGAKILGHNPEDILPISLAHKQGLGEIDLSKVKIKEIAL